MSLNTLYKSLCLITVLLFSSCEVELELPNDQETNSDISVDLNTDNSSNTQTDSQTSTQTTTQTDSQSEPLSALEIIEQQCANCHSGIHDAWQGLSSQQWVDIQGQNELNLIDSTDPLNSIFLQRIKYYMGEFSSMPPENNNATQTFTLEHFQTLQQWTQEITGQYIGETSNAVSIEQIEFDESQLSIDYQCVQTGQYQLSIYNTQEIAQGAIATQDVNCDLSNITLENNWSTQQLRIDIQEVSLTELAASQFANITYSSSASCQIQEQLLPAKLRRLSQSQIKNSIQFIFGDIFSEDTFIDLEDGAKLIGMNDTADKLTINNLNFEQLFAMSSSITNQVLDNHNTFTQCIADNDSTCSSDIKNEFMPLLWRKPLTDTENQSLTLAMSELEDNQERLSFLLQTALLSSNFLFRSEIGVINNSIATLTNYELVSLLSFSILNRTPDQTLLDLAGNSNQLTSEDLNSQIPRLLNESEFQAAMMQMYQDYLKLELVLSRPKDESFEFTDSVRENILESAQLSLLNNISSSAVLTQVLQESDYYVNSEIDYLFNLDVAQTDLTTTNIDALQRQGLLNHPAFLSVHSTLAKSGIVKRGVFTLEQLLCQHLPEPPASVETMDPPQSIDPEQTSERDLLQITHSSQSGCNGCHDTIDPAGFGLENFDSIGRYRDTEKENVAIDASGSLSILKLDGQYETLSYETSSEFSNAIMQSEQFQSCLTHRFLEHFVGEDLNQNACEAQKFQQALSQTDSQLADLIAQLIQLESFYQRSVQ